MKSRAIITSASNKFFPSLLNLIGSIKQIQPDHPPIYIYDIGLFSLFRKELESIPGVKVVDMPHFVSFWRACYTWKTHIFVNPFADLNLYLDAGCQLLKPIDEILDAIDSDGYFAVGQGALLSQITPIEYFSLFGLPENLKNATCITAGIFGFKKDSTISKTILELHEASLSGLCLGFSQDELWKNKGVNKTNFIRNCKMFRHDTTLLTILLHRNINELKVRDVNKYAGAFSEKDHSEQVIWNLRMNYKKLSYISPSSVHKSPEHSSQNLIGCIFLYSCS